MSYYQGDADLPPGYSSRYSPPPTEPRPPSPGPTQRDAAGGPVVYDYSHGGGDSRRGGGGDDRRGRGAPGRPSSPGGGATYGEYPSDVKPNIDRHTGVVDDGRRGLPRSGYDHKSRRPRSPNEPYYPPPRPHDGDYPTPPPHHRGGRGDHHQSRSRPRPQDAVPSPPPPRRRIPSPTELYGPPQPAVPYDRYGAHPPAPVPVRRDDRYDHGRMVGHAGRSPSPPSHVRRRSPPSPRRIKGGEPRHGDTRDPYYSEPRDPAQPPSREGPPQQARFRRDRSPLPHHHSQQPLASRRVSPGVRDIYAPQAARPGREESPSPHLRKPGRGSPQSNRDYYSRASPAPFEAQPLRRASPPPQAYREPGPYSPPPQKQPPPAQHPERRQTPSPYRTPSPPKREAFGHNLDNARGGGSPSPRSHRLPEQFKDGRNSRERLPLSEPYRPEYDRGRTSPLPHQGQQIPVQHPHARKLPRSPSGSPTRQRGSSSKHHGQPFDHPQGQPAKRPRSPSAEKPAPFDDPDYPEGICKEWFDTGICRKPIGGCFMAHSLPESPVSKHRRKKYSEKEKDAVGHERRASREQHIEDGERAARKAEKRGASSHAPPGEDPYAATPPPHARPLPDADPAYKKERQAEDDRKEAKKLCREWAVGACDSANKKCRRRHYFINDEADYYNDISATANALASEQRPPQSSEEDSEWVSWISDQTRSWQVQKRVNEQRAEEERRAGQSDATTAIMRRQMEEYQQQMQTWMVEMNDWMKTQTLTPDKLKEMRQMIKVQMEQVRQVAESAEYMATHGPGNVPAGPESSSATPTVPTATGQHPQPPPYVAPAAVVPGPTTPAMAPPKANPMAGGAPPVGLPGSQPMRPEGLSLPPPHGLPPFDPMRPPPMFQPTRVPPPQALPPNFQPHNPPPGYVKPIGVNTAPPPAGGPAFRPDLVSPPPAHSRATPDEDPDYDPTPNEAAPQKYKPCFNFRRGKCSLTEEDCPYSHSIERKDKPCIAYNQAVCRFDNDCCTYQHVCKNCGGPNPAIQCGCGQERSPDELKAPMIERVKKRIYWKEMERVAKERGEKGELWRNNRSPSPDICVKWNEKGMGQCPLNASCRYMHRCKSCWGPDPYYNCVRCNGNAKEGGAKPCPDFATKAGCKLGYGCAMAHYCSTCKASFLEHNTDCKCHAVTEPEDSDVQRGVPKSKASEDAAEGAENGVIIKFVKEDRPESTAASDAFPKDVCRMFNLGICKNANCPQQHKCAKCLKHGLNLMTCNCAGAKDFRNTISSGVKKEEPKKPDLPLGGCIKFNLGTCSEKCDVGHHCAICLGKNAAKICACQGAKDLRKALVTLEEMELRRSKKNAVRLETRGWPDKICRNFNVGTCSKQDCSLSHICVKCSSSSPVTTCSCDKALAFQADVEGLTEEMDDVTAQIKIKPEKSTDLNFARGGWPRGVCKNFNSGTCPFPTCKYFHKCAKCMGPDPMQSCACFGGEDFRENPTLEREMMDALTLYDLNISTLLNCARKLKEEEARAARGDAQETEATGKDDVDNDGWSYVREICQAYNASGCEEGAECKRRHVCSDCLGPFPRAKSHKCKGSVKDKFVCKEFQTGQCLRGGRCPFPHRCHDCQGPIPRAKCHPCINRMGPYPPRNRNKDGPPRLPGPPRSSGQPRSLGPRPSGPPHPRPPTTGPLRPAGPPPQFGGPPPRLGAPPPRLGAPPPQLSAPPPHLSAPPPHLSAPPPHLSAPPPVGPFRPPPMSHHPPSSAAPAPSSILGAFPGTPGILGPAPGGPPPIRGAPPPGGALPGMVRPGLPPPHHLQPPMMDPPPIRPNGAGRYPPGHPGNGMNGANGRGVSPSGIVLDTPHDHRRPPHQRINEPYYSREPMDREDDGAEPESAMRFEGALPERMDPDFTEDDIDPSSAVGFANDGSFAEFAQGVIQQQKKEHPKHGTPLPTGLNKRVGGKALKTGMVIKSKKPEDKPKDGAKDDAWSKYMEEVKRMSGGVCERGGGGNSSLAQ